jgi:hypothetical protein
MDNLDQPKKTDKTFILILLIIICFCCLVSSSLGLGLYLYNTSSKAVDTTKTKEGIKARYVKLQRTDGKSEFINILEIEVYDQNNTKITTGITPSLHPQYDKPELFGPQFLIDSLAPDNFPSGWKLPHTTNVPNAYMQLDLNQDTFISKVVIKNRLDCCKERIVGCSLLLINSSNSEVYKKSIDNIQNVYEFIIS